MFRPKRSKFCPVTVYDVKHIEQVGYKCPYKHKVYNWPAEVQDNFSLISDSLCKLVNWTNQIYIQAYPGLTIAGLRWKIGLNSINLKFKILVLHVGTNDLESHSADKIIADYENLIKVISAKSKGRIAVSAIIPRPKDERLRGEKRKLINRELFKLCQRYNCSFLKTYHAFERNGKIQLSLFAKDGLHLSHQGVIAIKAFIVSSVIRIQGELKE